MHNIPSGKFGVVSFSEKPKPAIVEKKINSGDKIHFAVTSKLRTTQSRKKEIPTQRTQIFPHFNSQCASQDEQLLAFE